MALYFTMFYKKTEVSKRIAMFIGAGSAAGAFGGLIRQALQPLSPHPRPEARR